MKALSQARLVRFKNLTSLLFLFFLCLLSYTSFSQDGATTSNVTATSDAGACRVYSVSTYLPIPSSPNPGPNGAGYDQWAWKLTFENPDGLTGVGLSHFTIFNKICGGNKQLQPGDIESFWYTTKSNPGPIPTSAPAKNNSDVSGGWVRLTGSGDISFSDGSISNDPKGTQPCINWSDKDNVIKFNKVPSGMGTVVYYGFITKDAYHATTTNAYPKYGNSCCEASIFFPSICSPEPACLLVASFTDKTICQGEQANFSPTIEGATGVLTYSWNGPGGFTSTSATITVSVQGTYTLTVRDNMGTSGNVNDDCVFTESAFLTVNAVPSVTISGTTTICDGSSTTLTANASGGTSGSYSYLWSTGASTQTISVNPSVSTLYSVTVSRTGCTSSAASVTVTVNTIPSVTISGTTTICEGSSTTLTANASNGSGTYSYTWSNSSTAQSITVSPTSNTTYTVTVTSAGCTATSSVASVEVTVNTVPSVTISGTTTICDGSSTTLTANASGGTSGSYSYLWSTGASTQTISVNPSVSTLYSVTVSRTGCTSSAASVTVTVNTIPSVTISGTTTICEGSSTTLTANASNGSGTYSYTWSNSSTAQSITVSPTSNTTYTVTVTSAGCTATSSVASVEVTVNTVPSVTISGTTTICDGSSTTLTANASGGTSGSYSFLWSTGASTQTISVNPSVSTLYSVTVSRTGCTSSAASVTVTVNTIPSVTISGTTTICDGSSTTLTANASGGTSGSYSYLWSTGASTQTISVNPSVSTLYSVTVSRTGCTSSAASVTVTVNYYPTITLTISPNPVCLGSSAAITVAGYSTGAYSWVLNSGLGTLTLSTATSVIYTAPVSNVSSGELITYSTTLNGCSKSFTETITWSKNCETFCTYSQGYYGNPGGKSCIEVDEDDYQLKSTIYRIREAFANGGGTSINTIKFGTTNYFEIRYDDVNRTSGFNINDNKAGQGEYIFKMLPGGGTPRPLPGGVSSYANPNGVLTPKPNGTWPINNNLLSQAITMWFNVYSSPNDLGGWKLPLAYGSSGRTYTVSTVSVNCEDISENGPSSSSTGSPTTYDFPSSMAGLTVDEVLAWANHALGGTLGTANATYSRTISLNDVHQALGTLVDLFHGCKVVTSFGGADGASNKGALALASSNANSVAINSDLQVKAFPNPYTDQITFTVSVKNAGKGSLVLYNALGQRIANVFEGDMQANSSQTIRYTVPSSQRKSLVYVFRQNGNTNTGRLISGK